MNPSETETASGAPPFRGDAFALLRGALERFAACPAHRGGLEIVGVSGYGGIGKSFLAEAAFDSVRGQFGGSLVVRVDGHDEKLLRDFARLVDQQVAPMALPPPARPNLDYFPATREMVRRQRELSGLVDHEVEALAGLGEQVKVVARHLYRLSPAVRCIPRAGPVLAGALRGMELVHAEELVGPAIEALGGLRVLTERRRMFGNPLVKGRYGALRHNPLDAFADAYVSDLSAMLSGYRRRDRWRLTHRRLPGLDRLLLVVDDFEVVGDVLGTFLVNHVFPALRGVRFPTLAVIIGRDALYDAHPDFAHHLGGNLKEQVRLEPFSQPDAARYLVDAGYPEAEALELAISSRGFPFILRLFADSRSDAGRRSALFYRRFYERTTRWMTPDERAWLQHLCYLDEVNLSSVRAMLPDAPAHTVMEWFASEASVRDTASPHFTVHPFIRQMLAGYYRRVLGEAEHHALEARARAAAGDGAGGG